MKLLLILANGFEDTEALTTRDVLLRSGFQVTTATINSLPEVKTSFGITMRVGMLLSQVDYQNYDGIILPGGKVGVDNLFSSKLVEEITKHFASSNKLVGAICAAPSLLTRWNLLNDNKYTCYSGFEVYSTNNYTGNGVEISSNFITAKSMYYSIDFALAITEKLLGKEIKEKVTNQIKSIK